MQISTAFAALASFVILASATPLPSLKVASGDLVARVTGEEIIVETVNEVDNYLNTIESRSPAEASEDFIGGLLSGILGCETDDDWSMPKPTVSCNADNLEQFKYHCANDKDAKDPATMTACLVVEALPQDTIVTRETMEEILEEQVDELNDYLNTIESRSPAEASENIIGGLLSSLLGCETADDWSMPKPTVSCNADNIDRFKSHCANDKGAKDPATMTACLIVVRALFDISNLESDTLSSQHECPAQEALPKDTVGEFDFDALRVSSSNKSS
ncbi:hypothetical protein HWV62_49 [Athelia sp. TMB]|nr:hypothetical protein HWV62_49 [Athelia sp. TMB]